MKMACKCFALVSAASAFALAGLPGCANSKSSGPIVTAPSEDDLRRATALANEAQAALNNGDSSRAIELFTQSLTVRSDIGGVWNNFGLALKARGAELDYLQAAEAFKRAADLLPVDERPYQNLGVLYHERGFGEEALRYFTMALERNPNSLESLRGAISSSKVLLRSDEGGLARVNRALMIETDPTWRKIEEFEKLRIQHDLAERYASPTR